jgi:diacylglycerol kinase
MSTQPGEVGAETSPPKRKKPRPWRQKFGEAFRGIKLGIRGHSSFYIHFFFAVLVVAVANALQCGWVEWCILLGCIGMVFTAELFNSAIETLFHGLDAESKNRIQGCLDIAAGAVLMASITAAIVGGIVLVRQFNKYLS